MPETPDTPSKLDLKKDSALTIRWQDGRESVYPIEHLRRLSPSADMRELRRAMDSNPLTVLPAGGGASSKRVATDAALVGNYHTSITFSDAHSSGTSTHALIHI